MDTGVAMDGSLTALYQLHVASALPTSTSQKSRITITQGLHVPQHPTSTLSGR